MVNNELRASQPVKSSHLSVITSNQTIEMKSQPKHHVNQAVSYPGHMVCSTYVTEIEIEDNLW